ncbi:MAG: STAS-like domain-containing protein [Saprospiraceae bacterium]|jgi:hypothetical protein|nr:STAS-like domain-containing protein [Saprospiraceae bacterium]
MVTVRIKDVLDGRSYPDGGTMLFGIIKDAMNNNENVSIDMEDVDSFPTMFMNTSFGKLIELFGIDATKKALSFQNIKKVQIERIRKYFNDYMSIMA